MAEIYSNIAKDNYAVSIILMYR